MALFKNCEVFYVKCDPTRPNPQLSKENPTWEVQLRTTNPEQRDEWLAGGLRPKLIVGKPGTEDEGVAILHNGKKQWRVNLKKKSKKRDGTDSSPVEVVNGALQAIDPNTIGNGSICHVQVWQYDYKNAAGEKVVASVLTGLQVKRHLVYNRPVRDDAFGAEDTETIAPDDEDDDDIPFEQGTTAAAPAPSPAPSAPAPALNFADKKPETAF